MLLGSRRYWGIGIQRVSSPPRLPSELAGNELHEIAFGLESSLFQIQVTLSTRDHIVRVQNIK